MITVEIARGQWYIYVNYYFNVNRGKPMEELLTYTVDQVAEKLGIGRVKAYEGVKAGEIPSLRIGRRIVVPIAAFNKYLETASQPQPNP
jgi:excisionase family DNA binding protein